MLERLIEQAIKMKASDIHITSNDIVTFRIDKKIIKTNATLSENEVIQIAKYLCSDQYNKFLEEKQIDIAGNISDVRYRANCYFEKSNIAIAIRLFSKEIQTIDKLKLPQVLKNLVQRSHGFILVTGPTGSGKSTTLAAMINEINKTTSKHIVTIEDPIEYLFTNDKSIIHQREVGTDVPTFDEALRSVLRQDPDVIMIGEMRDKNTVETALKASETGHLVISTLHTSNVASSLNRLTGVFSAEEAIKIRAILADSLIAIVSQQLIPRIDTKGVVPAVEIMINHTPTANLIRKGEGNQINSYLLMDQKIGSIPMDKSIEEWVAKGVVEK